jgi:hypothetical protein
VRLVAVVPAAEQRLVEVATGLPFGWNCAAGGPAHAGEGAGAVRADPFGDDDPADKDRIVKPAVPFLARLDRFMKLLGAAHPGVIGPAAG